MEPSGNRSLSDNVAANPESAPCDCTGQTPASIEKKNGAPNRAPRFNAEKPRKSYFVTIGARHPSDEPLGVAKYSVPAGQAIAFSGFAAPFFCAQE